MRKICCGFRDNSIEELNFNGNNFKDSIDLAKIFNDFFVNIANDLTNNLPHSAVSPYLYV